MIQIVCTVKYEGGGIITWDRISVDVTGASQAIKSNINGESGDVRIEFNLIGQEKGEGFNKTTMPKMRPQACKKDWPLIKLNLHVWPGQSPASKINILWRILKSLVHQKDPDNLGELKTVYQEEWDAIQPKTPKSKLLHTVDVSKL